MIENNSTADIIYCSFSGGLDSTTMVTYFLLQGRLVRPVFFYYGSKHNDFELQAAKKVISYLADRHTGLSSVLPVIDLRSAFSNTHSALLAADARQIPDASYSTAGSLAETVVPGRNLIMASVLASMAETEARRRERSSVAIALGVHAGDHALYPDCRPRFIDLLRRTLGASTEKTVGVEAPFLSFKKSGIVKLASKIGAPLHLTRSCYKMQGAACGQCGTCRERLAAFAENNLTDPISYMNEVE